MQFDASVGEAYRHELQKQENLAGVDVDPAASFLSPFISMRRPECMSC